MTNEEAIKMLKSKLDGHTDTSWEWTETVRMAIQALSTESKWIPVSEKLPNFNDIVLASADIDYDELRVILTVYGAEEYWFNGRIKAWMPVPKPYKAESEEK